MKSKLLFLLIPILIVGFIFRPHDKTSLPPVMEGIWVTDDVRYEDRFFQLSQVSVIFGTGKSNIDVYFITEIKSESVGSELVFEVSYHRIGEDECRLSLVYVEDENGSLKFLNQPNVKWTKIKEDELSLI